MNNMYTKTLESLNYLIITTNTVLKLNVLNYIYV